MSQSFVLRGRPTRVSREQVRSFLAASLAVLGYHGWRPAHPLDVRLRQRLPQDLMGQCYERRILLRASLTVEEMLTTVLHEVIHGCRLFPADTLEKCTSTLCSRLKPDVARVADVLLTNTYQRAAFLAHTRLSYRATDGDFYDPAEDAPVGVRAKYGR